MEKFITIKKRVCDLKVGDRFRYMLIAWEVVEIKNGKVWYMSHYGTKSSFGEKSQQKVEIIN